MNRAALNAYRAAYDDYREARCRMEEAAVSAFDHPGMVVTHSNFKYPQLCVVTKHGCGGYRVHVKSLKSGKEYVVDPCYIDSVRPLPRGLNGNGE